MNLTAFAGRQRKCYSGTGAPAVLPAVLLVIAGGMLACEARSTGDFIPSDVLETTVGARPVARQADGISLPAVVAIRDGESGHQIGIAARLAPDVWIGVAGTMSETAEPTLDPDGMPVRVTALSGAGAKLVLLGEGVVPEDYVSSFDDLVAGDRLTRIDWDGRLSARETLEVLAVADGRVVPSCPRDARGLIFSASGAWLPLAWQIDSASACPVLERVAVPTGQTPTLP